MAPSTPFPDLSFLVLVISFSSVCVVFSIARARALPVPGGALLRRERVRRSALRRRGARRAVGGGRGRDPGPVGAVGGGRL